MKVCNVEGCERKHKAKGMCQFHYQKAHQDPRRWMVDVACTHCGTMLRKWQHKDRRPFCDQACYQAYAAASRPPKPTERPSPPLDMRSPLRRAYEDGHGTEVLRLVRSFCTLNGKGCWEWTRQRSPEGYAFVSWPVGKKKVRTPVHRMTLEAALAAPLGGQPVHHSCANRSCVNPSHLQPVTHSANAAEMLARRYYIDRIRQLESALASCASDHPLLREVGVPDAA